MKFGKKQIVMAALVLALGAAVYLTWQFSGTSNLPIGDTASETSELGAAQLVNNAYVETMGDTVSQSQSTGANQSISEARVSRQASRDEAIELLDGVLANVDSESAAKEEAVTQASAIAQNILKETNVENLLTAKGYTESVAYINNGECNVVVAGEIAESDSLIIQEIVMEQTGLTAEKIKIIGTN